MNPKPNFTHAARETLLTLDIDDEARAALESADYDLDTNRWFVDIDDAAVPGLCLLLRENNARSATR
ncbi:hypothetical protein [Streptomyces sp. NRRL S-378]|uniref:hypothetical protein n=1 Tax=Streptomyces sp. NRRL S-378 TaxID=1463904 RepID=UPI0004C5A877|nr:hypothetical protein [Streptomyces sp. NRRL S-378]